MIKIGREVSFKVGMGCLLYHLAVQVFKEFCCLYVHLVLSFGGEVEGLSVLPVSVAIRIMSLM